MTDITVGSTVRLKSGGPLMTVRWTKENEAFCDWFAGDDVKHAPFKLSQLVDETDTTERPSL